MKNKEEIISFYGEKVLNDKWRIVNILCLYRDDEIHQLCDLLKQSDEFSIKKSKELFDEIHEINKEINIEEDTIIYNTIIR